LTATRRVWYLGVMKIALTGHRSEDCRGAQDVRTRVRSALQAVPDGPGEHVVICGMANGYDLWAGSEALRMGFPVWAAKPWAGHKPRRSDVELYAEVIDGASRVVDVHPAEDYPGVWVYQVRNIWMVDNATHLLAYHNGAQKGGTFNCLKYAKTVLPEDRIHNIYG
jgi:hypothetical protein